MEEYVGSVMQSEKDHNESESVDKDLTGPLGEIDSNNEA